MVNSFSWVAQHTDRKGWRRNYDVGLDGRLPRSKYDLVTRIEDVCSIARYHREGPQGGGLKEFVLQLWERPETRPFKKKLLMEFEITFRAWEEHPQIKLLNFDTSKRELWLLKQDFLYSGTMEAPKEPRQDFSEPDILTMYGISTYSPPYAGLNGRKGPYDGMSKRAQRSSASFHMHGPSPPNEKIVKPLWRSPLTKSWRESMKHGPREPD